MKQNIAVLIAFTTMVSLVLASCSTPAPTADPYASAPTKAPMAAATSAATAMPPMASDAVEVKDQEINGDTVVIAMVKAAADGWIVIHIDDNGKPGPVIGNSAVKTGDNKDVKVKIDTAKATPKLHAMLHVDKGVIGTYEFPGADVPVKNGDAIVMTPFTAKMAMAMASDAVKVSDQTIAQDDYGYGSTVTINLVSAAANGWIVIHIDDNGKPGGVIGQTAVKAGENKDVKVKIDAAKATPKLHAMLHVDKGVIGTYEFPGADVPVKNGDAIVMTPFNVKK